MRTGTLALSAALTVALFAGTALAQDSKPLALGATAPMATVKMKNAVDGKQVSIADVKGKAGTLVVFTCNHCPYAKGWEERIVALAHEYAKKGIGSILINSNDPSINKGDAFAEMETRAKERGMKVPYVANEDSSLARAFGATVTPEAFLFDKAGKLVYHGTIDDNHKDAAKVEKKYLEDALKAVSAGKPVPTAETKSIGCTIKFRKVS